MCDSLFLPAEQAHVERMCFVQDKLGKAAKTMGGKMVFITI
jgi:hypothetical protein